MTDKGEKDGWDIFGIFVPLIVGLAVAGVGGWFTYVSNQNQLQLSRIQALDKFRPLLTSSKSDERAFGYTAFTVLGYERLAFQIIQLSHDDAGRQILLEAAKSGTAATKAQAKSVLASLDMVENEKAKGRPSPTSPVDDSTSLKALHNRAVALQVAIESETNNQDEFMQKRAKAQIETEEKVAPGSSSHMGPGSIQNQLNSWITQSRGQVAEKYLPDVKGLLMKIDASPLGLTQTYSSARLKVMEECYPPYLGRKIECAGALKSLVVVIPYGGN